MSEENDHNELINPKKEGNRKGKIEKLNSRTTYDKIIFMIIFLEFPTW